MVPTRPQKSWIVRLLLILGSVLVSALLKYLSEEYLGETPRMILFVPAVILCSYIGGFVTGALATVFSGLIATYFFFYPNLNFIIESADDQIQLEMFCVVCIVISYLISYLQRQHIKWLHLNQTKDRFIGILGHELRSPLQHIQLLVTDRLSDNSIDLTTRATLLDILDQNELQQVIINDVLDMSRVSAHKLAMELEALSLSPVIQGVLRSVGREARAKGIKIRVRDALPDFWVLADKNRIKQVFWNVLRNAIKFAPENTEIVLWWECLSAEGKVRVSIMDQGPGLSKQQLSQIFEPYTQVLPRKRMKDSGLGLGLAICKAIMDHHEGFIWAESPGLKLGSTFHIDLKFAEEPAVQGPMMDDSYSAPALTILLIDDDTSSARLMQSILQRKGCQTFAAATLQEAYLLDPTVFDLVITDYYLPDGLGTDALQFFRTKAPGIPVIALSGAAESKGHFDAWLQKPISVAQIDQLLKLQPTPKAPHSHFTKQLEPAPLSPVP